MTSLLVPAPLVRTNLYVSAPHTSTQGMEITVYSASRPDAMRPMKP
jgi:hypothetical protein